MGILPAALKAGIIMGAAIAAFKRVFVDDAEEYLLTQPLSTLLSSSTSSAYRPPTSHSLPCRLILPGRAARLSSPIAAIHHMGVQPLMIGDIDGG